MNRTTKSDLESHSPNEGGVEAAICARLQRGQKVLAPFFTAGFPDETAFVETLRLAQECGSDLVEVGVPFSDPIADGPEIQHASQRALEREITIDRTLDLIVEADISIPVILMSYLNPILAYGSARLARNSASSRVRGIIIPDLAFDPSSLNGRAPAGPSRIASTLRDAGLDVILLSAPTTQPARLASIGRQTRGFLYAITLTGVTGVRSQVERRTLDFLKRAGAVTPRPVLAGFGIGDARCAVRVASLCDGVIVGSALIQILRESPRRAAMPRLGRFLKQMRIALNEMNGD